MTTLCRGGEDIDFSQIGGSYGLTGAAGIYVNSTVDGSHRPGYARCALSPGGGIVGGTNGVNSIFIRSRQFNASGSFWTTARLCYQGTDDATLYPPAHNGLLCFRDSGLVARLRLMPATGGTMNNPFKLQKVTASGTVTDLATSSSAFSISPSTPDKLDIFVNYAVSGGCQIYINGTLVLTYTGDVTTDSATALAFVELGSTQINDNSGSTHTNWSELIVSTIDTRNQSLVIRAPTGTGNADAWTGAYTDIDGLLENDASPNVSGTAGQVQQYTVNSLPSGAFAILDVTQTARSTIGLTGPQNMDLGNRVSGADYFSSNVSGLSVAWGTVSYTTTVSPATGALYTQTELNAGGYNIGMKSAT